MAENEPRDPILIPDSSLQEIDELAEQIKSPLNQAIIDAVFHAPFDMGREAVRQFVKDKVREKFPDYEPPTIEST